jgi:2-polyprenyl-3-methyl-5-hydroxy-6-metoxy-1,4-benzoquinol methylase
MRIPFEIIFRNSEIFNPVSQTNLFLAGKLAQMSPDKSVIDLASGSGYPSLLWASVFGIHVDGYDLGKKYVEYANMRAKLLCLDGKVQYLCQDLTDFTPSKKYDVVAALGCDVSIFGGRIQALNRFKNMLNPDGTIIFSEPIWITKPTQPHILKSLNLTQGSFLTITEMQNLFQEQGLRDLWHVTSTKDFGSVLKYDSLISSLNITSFREPEWPEQEAKLMLFVKTLDAGSTLKRKPKT